MMNIELPANSETGKQPNKGSGGGGKGVGGCEEPVIGLDITPDFRFVNVIIFLME